MEPCAGAGKLTWS